MLRSRALSAGAAIIVLAGVAVIAQSGAKPQQIRANGVDLSYVSEGSGAPVVFAHGAVADLRYWEPQRAAFAKRFRFI